jgi:hypothetical protein
MARLELAESPEWPRTVLIGDFHHTLAKVILADPVAALVEILLGVVTHHVHAMFAIRIAHLETNVVAALLVVTSRHRNIINGLLARTNSASSGCQRLGLSMLATQNQNRDNAWPYIGYSSHGTYLSCLSLTFRP